MPRAINRLSPEVLAAICRLCGAPRRLNRDDPNDQLLVLNEHTFKFRNSDIGWIRLSHVDRTWRTLILGIPSLWADIARIFSHPEAQETVLERAGDVAMTISTTCFAYSEEEKAYNADVCQFAYSRIHNIRSLTLHFGPQISREFDGRARESLSFTNLALLTELSLSIVGAEGQDTPPINAPNLRVLTLKGVWCRFASQDLRYLDYTVCAVQTESVSNLLDILRDAPHLQTLRLTVNFGSPDRAVGPFPPIGPFPQVGAIHLPHLKLLYATLNTRRIWDRTEDVTAFFRLLTLPSICTVHINDASKRRHAGEWDASLNACGRFLHQHTYDAVGFYAVNERNFDRFYVSAFTVHPTLFDEHARRRIECCVGEGRVCRGDPSEPLPSPHVRLHLTGAVKVHEVLPQVMHHLQPAAITHLVLHNLSEDAVAALCTTLCSFTEVTTLNVRSRLNVALHALSAVHNSEGEAGEPLLPALRNLTVTFFGIENHWADLVTKWWMTLLNALEHRRHIGLPVRKLHLVGRWSSKPGSMDMDSDSEDDEPAPIWRRKRTPSAYDQEVARDAKLAKDEDRTGLARARDLVEELIDERTF